jgi:multiple sugar transport system ATP-binding protein
MEGMATVTFHGVSKTYPADARALIDLSLQVADGELLAIVGPSGCGKTTLLRVLAGLTSPTAGSVSIAGREVTRLAPHKRDVAFVFQRPALYPQLTVRANLSFGLSLRRSLFRLSPGERRHVLEVAELLGLGALLDRRPAELSGGEQQRVALGRALVRRPAAYLLDEPLAALDARLRLELRRDLHLLQRRFRATMLYVTHDQEEAAALGDRVAVLDRGVLQQVGTPAVLCERPVNRFVAGFVGWPPMSFLQGNLVEDGGRISFRDESAATDVPPECLRGWQGFAGRSLVVGLRAEDARLVPGGTPGTIDMEVRRAEALGRAWLLTLMRGNWELTARLTDGPPPAEGSRATVLLDLTRAHLFDPATGRALLAG